MHPVIVAMTVIGAPVLGATVVAEMVVVTVNKLAVVPNPVAGMALPSPVLVHGEGIGIVLVSGFLVPEMPPYMLPLVPFPRV